MKHTWTIAYLEKRFSSNWRQIREWQAQKAKELEAYFMVPFSYAHYSGKIVFLPYMEPKTHLPLTIRPELEDHILDILKTKNVCHFVYLREQTGINYLTMFCLVKTLLDKKLVWLDVNRMGKPCFIRLRKG